MSMLREEEGGIVLEAAIVMPLLLSFVIVMIAFVQLAVTEMALQTAVSETSKYVAAHVYPLYLLSETEIGQEISHDVSVISERIRESKEQWAAADSLAQDYAAFIPESLLPIISGHQLLDELYDSGMNAIGLFLLKPHINERVIDIERLQVTKTILPHLQSRQHVYIGLEVRYVQPLRIPFFQRDIILSKSSYERVWIGA